MEGIGSTILAKLIFHHKAVIDYFPFSLWTSDGYILLLRQNDKIMESLLKPEWRYEEKRQRLEAFFVNNRSLIVVENSPFPYEILQVLQDTFNGSRMILTGTKAWLPPDLKMKSDPHPLRLRTNEESWALFSHALNVGMPPELLNLKGEIAKICGGLPLLIVKLVEQLSHKDATIEDWSTV